MRAPNPSRVESPLELYLRGRSGMQGWYHVPHVGTVKRIKFFLLYFEKLIPGNQKKGHFKTIGDRVESLVMQQFSSSARTK